VTEAVSSVGAESAIIEGREAHLEKTTIRPSKGWASLNLADLWHYRELLYFLTWRDVKVRYKQTLIGAAWGLLQPLLMMVVFTVFLGRLTDIPSGGIPYPLFAYSALIPWTYFSFALNHSSNSLVDNSILLRRVYFPRLVLPISSMMSGLIDFCSAFLVLFLLMAYYGYAPTPAVLLLPFFLLLALASAFSVGVWFSALNVEYRDIRHTIPFLTQLWLFATPVAYPSSLLDEPWRTLYGLNPMAGVVDGFRWALLGYDPPGAMIIVSVLMVTLLLTSGLFYFRRMERTFGDIV
jgi:lipopolysaccharide transport system permease protein